MKFSNTVIRNLLFLCAFGLGGCGYWSRSNPQVEGFKPLTAEEKLSLSYEAIKPVIEKRCGSCHGTSGGVNLETYENVMKNLAAVKRTVLVTGEMPPRRQITQRELQMLESWIEMGAPATKPDNPIPTPDPGTEPTPEPQPTATPAPDNPLEPTYESIREQILSKRCIGCHSETGKAKHIPLVTKSDLIDSPREIVIPGNPEESGIVIALERQDDKRMPPPSKPPLTRKQIEVIKEWIADGAN